MAFDIRDLSTIKHTLDNLAALIEACAPRKAFYAHDKHLTNAVIREAKGLQTALGHLQNAIDNPNHKPHEPVPSTKSPLATRLGLEPHLHELAKFVSYGGKRADQMKSFMVKHAEKHGDKAKWALIELTTTGDKGLTVLRPEAKRACRVLLGPAPDSEEYSEYWRKQGCPPPEDHRPPAPPPAEEPEAPKKPARKGRGR